MHPGSRRVSVSVSFSLPASMSLFPSHLVLDLVEVVASAHVSPQSQEAPGSMLEKEGMTATRLFSIGAAG